MVRCFSVVLLLFMSGSAWAQAPREARVQVTVVDSTGGVLPGAMVTLTGAEPAIQGVTIGPVTGSEKGLAVIESVRPGRYAIHVEFPGFDNGDLPNVSLRPGDNRQTVTLQLQKLESSVTVARDAQTAAADRKSTEFGDDVSKDRIEALADDPAELEKQLRELAGSEAVIRVDSFEGQQLPPKAQIKSIHVTRDQFAAEVANPGTTFVDIITQPGIGPVRGGANYSFRNQTLTSKSPFVSSRGPEGNQNFGINLGGALVAGKTGFNVSVNGNRQYLTPILNAQIAPGQSVVENLSLRQTQRPINVSGVVDQALTRDQTLKVSYNVNNIDVQNFGVGNLDLPERAWDAYQHIHNFRVQEAGPIGRRSFLNTRLAFQNYHLQYRPTLEAPTTMVLGAFTKGGANQKGDQIGHNYNLASDLDYVQGIHSFRVGTQVDVQRYRSDVTSNYLGTYTYGSVDDYAAGRPLTLTRAIGDPLIAYTNVQAAWYAQDDIRLKGVTLSPGVRYSVQNQVDDRTAIEPRFGVTWSPSASGRTTLRASAGIFHGFLPPYILEQALRVDGVHQREELTTFAPDGSSSASSAPNVYRLGDFRLQRNIRYSAGIDQTINPLVKFNVLYNYIHLQQQPRGRNLNPLIDGVRPDPSFANVIEIVTDTEIRRHEVYVNSTIALAPPSPALQRAFFDWRRLNVTAGYTLIHARNNSDGPFAVPPSGDPAAEWGPGPADAPYRVNIVATSTQLRNLTGVLTWIANSGQPYTLITGYDDNGDGITNDRPAGVGLRSLRMASQFTMNARLTYALPIGPAAQGGVPPRYRANLFANLQNLTDHRNYIGYYGNMRLGGDRFMQPTAVQNPRRIDVGLNVTF